LDNVVPLKGFYDSKKLPDNNKRLADKAKNLIELRDDVKGLDASILTLIPFSDSSSLGLYNAFIESLELDNKRIMAIVEG
jgi:hypothetical protein